MINHEEWIDYTKGGLRITLRKKNEKYTICGGSYKSGTCSGTFLFVFGCGTCADKERDLSITKEPNNGFRIVLIGE